MVTTEVVKVDCLALLRAAGQRNVRRRLERLVNDDVIGVAGAQKLYRDAFGIELVAVKDTPTPAKKRPFFQLSRWTNRNTQ